MCIIISTCIKLLAAIVINTFDTLLNYAHNQDIVLDLQSNVSYDYGVGAGLSVIKSCLEEDIWQLNCNSEAISVSENTIIYYGNRVTQVGITVLILSRGFVLNGLISVLPF